MDVRHRRTRTMTLSRLLSAPAIATLYVCIATPDVQAAPYAYIANMGGASVSVIDVATNVVIATIALPPGSDPRQLVASPDGTRLYVPSGGSPGSLHVVDTRTHALLPPAIPIGSSPSGVAVSADSAFVYVADQFSGALLVIDTARQMLVATVGVGGQPTGVGVLPDGSRVYVANCLGDAVTVLDASTLQQVGNLIRVEDNPQALTVSPDGAHVYVSNFNSATVSVIATASNTVEATIPVGSSPLGMDTTPDGRWLYVADQTGSGGSVAVIDTTTNTVAARVALPAYNTSRHVAVAPDGARAYVTINTPQQVIVFDTTTNQMVGSPITLTYIPEGIAIADIPAQDDLRKLAPANGAVDVRPAVGLAWLPALGATTYEYCYDTTDNGTCDGGWTTTSTTGAVPVGLQTATRYFWQVRTPGREADGGAWWSFTTAPAPPGAFAKITPPNSTAASLPVTLSWTPAVGASSYEVGYAAAGSGVGFSVSAGTSTSVTLTGLTLGAAYYWQVWAMNGGGTTAADDNAGWSFTVQAAAVPGPFAKNAPGNGSRLQPTALSLSWQSSAGAASYEYCYDTTDNDVCDSSWISTGPATTTRLGLAAGQTYFWQVRATNRVGAVNSDGGSWWSFSTVKISLLDFTGDGLRDIAVWRPNGGLWYVLRSSSNFTASFAVQWGSGDSQDVPVPGDYDGDGRVDVAVWRPGAGIWYILSSSSNYTASRVFQWGSGQAGDIPVPGDYDGDGRADIAVWRPAAGLWYILRSSTDFTSSLAVQWGSGALRDVPVPADYDGDGKMDIAVWRPGGGMWYVLTSSSGFAASRSVQWGSGDIGDRPVQADYDGDGKADIAVWRPGGGMWYIRTSSTDYATSRAVQWGSGDLRDVPVPGDYDGDGKADIAVWRPGGGTWYIRTSSTDYATSRAVQWGAGSLNDVPLTTSVLAR